MSYLRGTYPMVSNALLALASLYWGIHNEGEPQRISIDHFTSGYVMGVKGEDIHLPPASPQSSKVIVAVLDTGIDSNHPALKNVIAGKGFNFVSNNQDTNDTHGHGTHISGIIATQVSKNALILPVKVVQTGPNAPIRPQEVGPGAGTALTENVAKGIEFAVKNGAKVINLSLAWPAAFRSKNVDEAVALAEKNDVLIIASSANDSTSANLYPCIYSNVICVGAHGPDGAFTYFSNYGSMVDLLAPGIAILSTWPMNKAPVTFAGQIGYEFRNGTSMAAPFVAGAAAELLSRGYSASETKNRLLLGARSTSTQSFYSTVVVGNYSTNQTKEKKFSRFGNLDVSQALEVIPQSLILPVRKARNEIIWNGSDTRVVSNIQWKNNWKNAQNVKISINSQTFTFPSMKENESFTTPLEINLHPMIESTFDQIATIESDEESGVHTTRSIPLSFEIKRLISLSTLPANAIRYAFQGINPNDYSTIRSVVNVDGTTQEDELFLMRKKEAVLTRKGVEIGRTSFENILEEELKVLKFYRLDEGNYALVTAQQAKGEVQLTFYLKMLTSKLGLISERKLGTETTVLNEGFVWKKSNTGYSPLWISVGYTPKTEKPDYDPWNKDAVDPKIPRIYFMDEKDLHSITLADDEMPLQILPNGDVVIVKGNSYYAQYFIFSIDLIQKNKVMSRKEISLFSYRMLIGLTGSNRVWNLKGSNPDSILMVGQSTPGNLRATSINPSTATSDIDFILRRTSTLDSLNLVCGAFSGLDEQYFFVQTHYDIKFFHTKSNHTQSVSLERYSYIPSMIFTRNFFPVLAKDEHGNGLPTIYIPATIANAFVSDLIVGNPKTGAVMKPAQFHFQTGPECSTLGNFIQATPTEAAKEVFVCGNELVMIPLMVSAPTQ